MTFRARTAFRNPLITLSFLLIVAAMLQGCNRWGEFVYTDACTEHHELESDVRGRWERR